MILLQYSYKKLNAFKKSMFVYLTSITCYLPINLDLAVLCFIPSCQRVQPCSQPLNLYQLFVPHMHIRAIHKVINHTLGMRFREKSAKSLILLGKARRIECVLAKGSIKPIVVKSQVISLVKRMLEGSMLSPKIINSYCHKFS